MCGLFGGASSILNPKEMGVIKTLGLLSNLRGMHSTGVIMGNKGAGQAKHKGNKITWCKSLGPSVPFLHSDVVMDKTGPGKQAFLLAGHTRYATIGDVNKSNAHPFHKGSVVGMHNGTANSFRDPDGKTTDSERIYESMDRIGLDATLGQFNKWDAYALVWVDLRGNTLNMIRNLDRGLYIGRSQGNHTLVWASEQSMVEYAADRSNTTMPNVMALTPGTLYSFDLNNIQSMTVTDKTDKLKQETDYHNWEGYGYENGVYRKKKTGKKEKKACAHTVIGPDVRKTSVPVVLPFKKKTQGVPEPITRPVSQVTLTRRMLHNGASYVETTARYYEPIVNVYRLMKDGCCWCTQQSSAKDVINGYDTGIRWVNKSEHFCADCASDQEVKRNFHMYDPPISPPIDRPQPHKSVSEYFKKKENKK